MIILDMEQGSDIWKNYRSARLGASESAACMGIDKWTTPYQLYQKKMGLLETPDSPAMQRGRDREDEARRWFEEQSGKKFPPTVVESPLGWKFASLDGFSKEHKEALEIKWSNREVHQLARAGKVIDYYLPQLQSQMYCCDLDEMAFLSCYEVGGVVEFITVHVVRDNEMIERILGAEKVFYHEHMVKKVPPPLSDRDYESISPSLEPLFDEACQIDKFYADKIKELEAKRKANRESLMSLCDDRNIKSDKFKVSKIVSSGRIDYSKIECLKGIDLEPYRSQSSVSWRIYEA